MRWICRRFWLVALFLFPFPHGLPGDDAQLAPSDLPAFLLHYEEGLKPLDSIYTDLENQNLPLRDEDGQPLGRHPINDHRKALADLRQTLHQLAAAPQDLVLSTTLLVQTEELSDNVYDLSQIAYDNDREELASHLDELLPGLDRNKELIEAYTLSLAADVEKRALKLENENRALEQKLKDAAARSKAKPGHRRSVPEHPSKAEP